MGNGFGCIARKSSILVLKANYSKHYEETSFKIYQNFSNEKNISNQTIESFMKYDISHNPRTFFFPEDKENSVNKDFLEFIDEIKSKNKNGIEKEKEN